MSEIYIGKLGRKYKICKSVKLRLDTFDTIIPTATAGDHTQVIFPDDTSYDAVSNVGGVMTVLRNTNLDIVAFFNFSKSLGGTDEVRVVLINSDIFDITKIVKQAVFDTSTNPFKLTLNFTDTFISECDENIGEKFTLWIVRELGVTSGLVPLSAGHTQIEPSVQLEYTEIELIEI